MPPLPKGYTRCGSVRGSVVENAELPRRITKGSWCGEHSHHCDFRIRVRTLGSRPVLQSTPFQSDPGGVSKAPVGIRIFPRVLSRTLETENLTNKSQHRHRLRCHNHRPLPGSDVHMFDTSNGYGYLVKYRFGTGKTGTSLLERLSRTGLLYPEYRSR